jgi:hypothetical protein
MKKDYTVPSRCCVRGLTIMLVNWPPCACCGSDGHKLQYGLMKLAYQRFTALLSLICGTLFLSGVCYCLSVFWCEVARMSKFARPFGEVRWHFGPCHHRWWNVGLPIWPWNEADYWTDGKHNLLYCCGRVVFTELLPGNALDQICHNNL